MDLLFARLIEGLDSGAAYAFVALALVVVYRATGHLNFAQGEMAMFAAYCAWGLHAGGMPLAASMVLAIVGAAMAGGATQLILIRQISRRSDGDYETIIVTIGIFLILNAGAAVFWGSDPLQLGSLVPAGPDDYISVLGTRLRYEEIFVLFALAAVYTALAALFRFSSVGLAMRGSTSNRGSARLLGVRVDRVSALGWALAAAVGALAAMLIAPTATLTPGLMFNYLLYGAAAATLGGFDSIGGAVIAGLLLGVFEVLVAGYIPFIGPDLKQGFALCVILGVLLVRPSGLFGSRRVERV
jgi:branched-chain amino acid transport system permease protein